MNAKVEATIQTCREKGIDTISTCDHPNWDAIEHNQMCMLEVNPPADIKVQRKVNNGVCDWTLIRIDEIKTLPKEPEPCHIHADNEKDADCSLCYPDRKEFRDAERPEKIIGTREDRMRTFGAYQHFLYYFDQSLYEKEQPHGGMTYHFLRKLEMYRRIHSPEGYNSILVLVTWVQNMTSNNQEDLLSYILKHHSNKW